jgi:hypothetical protein
MGGAGWRRFSRLYGGCFRSYPYAPPGLVNFLLPPRLTQGAAFFRRFGACSVSRLPLFQARLKTKIISTERETLSGQPGGTPALRLCLLRFAFQGALEGLVQGGLGAFVFLLADAALFVFHFELEELFFQAFEQHGG